MLHHLTVRNIALIDSLEVDLGPGLNAMTGETGAGKSIVVDSINLALGERADREMIRSGAESAFVEAIFDVEDTNAAEILRENGIPLEDNSMIITREVFAEGKNICRINGRAVTLSLLREVTEVLVDMHGQHEHQALLSPSKHLGFLDTYGAQEITPLLAETATLYAQWKRIADELAHSYGDDDERERRIDILKYQIAEIENAALKEGEDEQLKEKKRLLLNAEKIAQAIKTVSDLISGNNGAADALKTASSSLTRIAQFDPRLETVNEQLLEAAYGVEELNDRLSEINDELEFDSNALDMIEERLELINKLGRKYGGGINEINSYFLQAQDELDKLLNSAQILERLRVRKGEAERKLYNVSITLSKMRKKYANAFEKEILEQLADLGMPSANFQVHFRDLPEQPETAHYSSNGLDTVEFLFSANAGEQPRSLNKIISGGEMSRFMLAIKAISANLKGVPSMIFDEIDTGISGRMAQAVAKKMALISFKKQIICVTHLPQIACMADRHFLIQKQEQDGKTNTFLRRLVESEIPQEIARLTGGESIAAHSVEHARELLDWADTFKKSIY